MASSVQGYDFAAYYRAGRAILDGTSPYPPEMLQGPFLLNLQYGFFYPPPFAGVCRPQCRHPATLRCSPTACCH